MEKFQDTLKRADDLLRRDFPFHHLSNWERSFAINLRAQCHFFLDEMNEAEKDYNESISLAPTEPSWYVNRARYWDKAGKPKLAEEDRRQAQALQASPEPASFRISSRPALRLSPNQALDGTR